jgi:aquaporin Z
MIQSLRTHWQEYLIEAFGLGTFMVAAGAVVTAIEIDASPIKHYIADPFLRRIPIGLAMGLTAIALIYSPWGKRSGAHLNPAVTLTFFRLGKLTPWDAFFYVLAQFIGGVIGVVLVAALFKQLFTEPPVSYVVTVPGQQGWAIAFFAEFLMAFGLMLMVLLTANTNRLANYYGMANMSISDQLTQENLSEDAIDRLVESQADDESAWEMPIQINQQPISLSIPAELAVQARFLANLEQEQDVKKWLIEMIREQLDRKLMTFSKRKKE